MDKIFFPDTDFNRIFEEKMQPKFDTSDVVKWYNKLVIVDVSRDNENDNRISSFDIYRLGEDKGGNREWREMESILEREMLECLIDEWDVKTGKVVGEKIKFGAKVETEVRVKENGSNYPLSSMGRS
ncbi:hypothetical protein K2X14_16155 [Acetobacter sp. TBRC 12305]|uniref:Uncharacterized protein n=1 Tax=Acetobacter garciniae TaxID=2817435 RepID=A0A939HMJ6_9PROT|nr:hypothetical protein [Acetobacter garciniae]MBO1326327.1 hypothetical protein [Acetobacter garciniae]MBX0346366.1 hypothetical protein [Acetobacter garciniae]